MRAAGEHAHSSRRAECGASAAMAGAHVLRAAGGRRAGGVARAARKRWPLCLRRTGVVSGRMGLRPRRGEAKIHTFLSGVQAVECFPGADIVVCGLQEGTIVFVHSRSGARRAHLVPCTQGSEVELSSTQPNRSK